METKFKIGDFVKVVSAGATYDYYYGWINTNCSQYSKFFMKGMMPKDEEPIGQVVCAAPHEDAYKGVLYGIMIKNHIFVIGEKGLAMANECVVELL